MGKRWMLLLVAILCTGMATASAATMDAVGQMAVWDGAQSVYVGLNNQLYRSDTSMPLGNDAVRAIVYADASKVIFTTAEVNGKSDLIGAGSLKLLGLGDEVEGVKTVAQIAGEAVYSPLSALIYYLDPDDHFALMSYNPLTSATREEARAQEAICALTASIDGVIVSSEAGDKLFVHALGELIDAPVSTDGMTIAGYTHYETLLGQDGALAVRLRGAAAGEETPVDTDVICASALGDVLYYLKQVKGGCRLASYDVARGLHKGLKGITVQMLPEITAAAGRVFLIDKGHRVYAYDVETGTITRFTVLDAGVLSPMLVSTNEQLLVYDGASLDGTMAFAAAYPYEKRADGVLTHVVAEEPAPEDEQVHAPVSTPTPEPTEWTRGSRGEEVEEIQTALKRHGYLSGKADGIYGANTQSAVKYLQYDMGLSETGTVGKSLLEKMNRGRIPDYEKYVEMAREDSGIRVYDLQARLARLGFLDARANGNYGPKTERAVRAFQKANGTRQSGVATVATLKDLFSKYAPKAEKPESPDPTPEPSHPHARQYVSDNDLIPLTRWLNDQYAGMKSFNKGKAVYWVQKKLYTHGYLGKNQFTKVYDEATWRAMKQFQSDNNLLDHPTGLPDGLSLSALMNMR
ncbi:MAG: peptidoglycan-binding protein [Clostridia bacterium]